MCISQLFPRVVVAELLSEVTIHDTLSLGVCMYVYTASIYIHIQYVCMYVYPFHSTWDTLIVQMAAVRRRCAQHLGSTLHNHWPWFCSLYHFIAVHSVQLCLLLNCVLNVCWHVRHFICGHLLRVAWVPAPTRASLGKRTTSAKYAAGLYMYGTWHGKLNFFRRLPCG